MQVGFVCCKLTSAGEVFCEDCKRTMRRPRAAFPSLLDLKTEGEPVDLVSASGKSLSKGKDADKLQFAKSWVMSLRGEASRYLEEKQEL